MRKIINVFCTFILFVLSINSVFAQSYQIYVSDIDIVAQEYRVGDTVNGSFKLSNLSEIPQSDIYYSISSGTYSNETLLVSNIQKISEKQGPLYVKGLSQTSIPFEYILPNTLNGQIAIQITATLKDGTLVGQSEYNFFVEGEAKQEIISVIDSTLTIAGFDDVIQPATGPTVYEDETIEFFYTLSPANTATVLTPVLRLYDRTNNSDSLIKTIEYDSIEILDTLTSHSINLPTDLDPLVYYGVLSFKNNSGEELFSTNLRYIIAGPIATIRNITTESLEVNTGDTFSAVVTYGGQPYDEYRPEKQVENEEANLTVIALNEKGEEIAKTVQKIDLNAQEKIATVALTAQNNAKQISFNSIIETNSGKILDEYKTNLPTEDELKGQKNLYQNNNSLLLVLIGSLILLVCIGILFFLQKKYKALNIPTVVFFGILISGFILSGTYATAKLNEEGAAYLEDLNSWSSEALNKITGWKVVQSENTLYDLNSTNTNLQNFQITAVNSPLPPKIKSYAPGEKFTLSFNAVYGDCNNESRLYIAYGYKPSIEWWKKTPKVNGEIPDRIGYWSKVISSQSGQSVSDTVKFVNISGQSNWKQLILQSDLQAIANLSVNKEKATKDIIKNATVENITDKCLGKLGCTQGSLSSYLFKEKDTANELISWVRSSTNKNETEAIKNIFLNDTTVLNDTPALKKRFQEIDFTKTGQLKSQNVSYENVSDPYTKEYLALLKNLNTQVREYTKPTLSKVRDWYSAGEHYTELTPVEINKVYTAPTTPGYHKIFFYLYQSGNSGERDITAVQTICVTGAGKCPGEKINRAPVTQIINATEITANQAKINWNYSDADGDKQTQYSLQISTKSNFPDTVETKKFWGGPEGLGNKDIRNRLATGLSANTTYHARISVKSDADTDPRWSAWSNTYTFKTQPSTCNPATDPNCPPPPTTSCDNSHTEGERYCDPDGYYHEWYCDAGIWKTKKTTDTCDSNTLSCSAGTFKKGEQAIYTATNIQDATYQWYINNTSISNATSYVYKETFNTNGSYSRKVIATLANGTTKEDTCTASVTEDGNPPGACDLSDPNCPDVNPPGGNPDTPKLNVFEFRPNIEDENEICPLIVDIENVKECRITDRGSVVQETLTSTGTSINVTGEFPVGTYSISCTDLNGTPTDILATRSCYSNPDIREN